MMPKTNLRIRARRSFAAVVAGAFVFGFFPASCHAVAPDVLRLSAADHQKAQCVEHEWHSKTTRDETVFRASAPVPKPFTFHLPAGNPVGIPSNPVVIPRKLPPDVIRRMRVPIRRMSMPYDVEGFLPYLLATRDA